MSKKVQHKPWEIIEPDLINDTWGFYAPVLPKNALENKVYSIKIVESFGYPNKQQALYAAAKHKQTFLQELDTKVAKYRSVVEKLDRYRATVAKGIILDNKTEGFVFRTHKFSQYFYYLKHKNKYYISKSGDTHRSGATRMLNTFAVRIAKGTITEAELKAFHREISKSELDSILTYHNRTAKK